MKKGKEKEGERRGRKMEKMEWRRNNMHSILWGNGQEARRRPYGTAALKMSLELRTKGRGGCNQGG